MRSFVALSLLVCTAGGWAEPLPPAFDGLSEVGYELTARPQLPTPPRHEAFRKVLATLSGLLKDGREAPSRLSFRPHEGGDGTSCYALLYLDGQLLGQIMPAGNESGNIETEANMWSLLRIFEHSEIGQPCGYLSVGRWGQEQFRLATNTDSGNRSENRDDMLELLPDNGSQNARFLFKWFDNSDFYPYSDAQIGYHLDPDFLLTRLLAADGPQPSKRPLRLAEGHHNSELQLARQFSTGLVADRIQGEWDRWTGSNLHVQVWDGRPNLAWLDNGGAEFDDVDEGATFERFVFRFDPVVVQRIRDLDSFLTGGSPDFLGFQHEKDLRQAFNIFSQASWQGFKRNLHEVRQTIDARVSTAADALLKD